MRRTVGILAAGAFLVAVAASPASAKAPNIVKVLDSITVERSTAAHDVVAVMGDIDIFGIVDGSVVAIGGDITIREGAQVKGDIVSIAGDVVREQGSVTSGNLTQIRISRVIPSLASFFKRGWFVVIAMLSTLVLIGFLGLSMLLIALVPRHMNTIIASLDESFLKMLGWGVLWTLFTALLTALLVISIVGILLIPLEILVIALALIVGYITGATFLGRNIAKSLNKKAHPLIEAVIGVVVLFFVGFMPVIGPVIKGLVLIAGFGAVIITGFGTRSLCGSTEVARKEA